MMNKEWLEKCYCIIAHGCHNDQDEFIEDKKEYCFEFVLEKQKGQDLSSEDFWCEISMLKAMISEQGSYDGCACKEGYCLEGIYESFDEMIDVARKISLSRFSDRILWKIYDNDE